MTRPVVIVFARAPRLGTVKRRLAKGVGERAALRFYRATLERLLRRLAGLRGVEIVVAMAPRPTILPCAPRLTRIGQGRGDLGDRMAEAFARFPRRPVVLIGSDIPDISAQDIRAALTALRGARAVIGPATDGGYWLIGFAGVAPMAIAASFRDVRWSGPHARADTLRGVRCRAGIARVAHLRMLADIDDAADLAVRQGWGGGR